ncbi:MAG: hypothetical protein ACRCZP_00700, partial [Phycicoccus sp.]
QPGGYAPPAPYAPPAAYGPSDSYGQPYPSQPAGPAVSPYPGYPPPPYAPPGSGGTNGSALAVTITSAVLLVFCCGVYAIPSGIFGIIGLTRQSTDPEGASRMAKYGWIALGVGVALAVLLVIGFFALGLAAELGSNTSPYDEPYGGY